MDEANLSAALNTPVAVPKPRINFERRLPAVNVAVSWASNILLTAGSFVVTPAMLRGLGERSYGIWLLITSYVAYLRLLDLGMTSGTLKFTAGCYERDDRDGLKKIFNTSVAIFLVAGTAALIVTIFLSTMLPSAYPDLEGSQRVIFLLGLSLVIELASRPFAANLRARSFFFVYDCVEIATYLLFKLGIVLYLCHIGVSLWALAIVTLTETVVRNLAVLGLSVKYCDWSGRPDLRAIDRGMLQKLIGYSSAVLLIGIADMLRFGIDNAVIGKLLPDPSPKITTYQIGYRLIGIVSVSVGVISSVLIPKFSGLYESGKREELKALLRKTSLVTGLFSAFSIVNLAVFGRAFLNLWIGKPWIEDSYIILLIALPGSYLQMLQGPAIGMLFGAGRLRLATVITIVEAVMNLALSLALAKPFGIFGVCLGTAIPMLLIRGLVLPIVLKYDGGIGIREYISMHRLTIVLTAVYSLLIVGFASVNYQNFLQFFLGCIASTAIFAVLLLACVPEARDQMKQWMNR